MSARAQQHSPGEDLIKLNAFEGTWNTTGLVHSSASSPAISIKGTDTYKWLPGKFFMLHTADVIMGKEHKQTTEIIGFDATIGTYQMHYFDSEGNSGTMQAGLLNDLWMFLGETIRFTGNFSNNGKTLSGVWQQLKDGQAWVDWMDIRLDKLPQVS